MIRNFFKFYDTYAADEQKVAAATLERFIEDNGNNPELDCSLVTKQDLLNLLLMEEFIAQEDVKSAKLLQDMLKIQRINRNKEIQNTCKKTLRKMPLPYRRKWIDRYAPDTRSPEQKESEQVGYALILLERDGVDNFAYRIAGNLNLMTPSEDKTEKTK